MSAVLTKCDMYRRLALGEFGNTIPQFFSVEEWIADPSSQKISFWGVRSATVAGHPACRLNCPKEEVADYAEKYFPGTANISMMVDKVANVLAWLEVWDSQTGLVVEGVPYPKTSEGWTWRNSMPDPSLRKQWQGSAARVVLNHFLATESYDSVMELVEKYPNHVIELSALDKCIGTLPMQNHIIWEVRKY